MHYIPKLKREKNDFEDPIQKIELATKQLTKDEGGNMYFKKLITDNKTYAKDVI